MRIAGIIMWTVVYISHDKAKVDKILALLEDKKIITMTKKSEESDFDYFIYEILVPKTELETAQEIIIDSEI